ncbi:hypothetical protein NSK_002120 [Nannochloropsis salina CCMP1776]|jgi:ubiquitin carboxyl-terminal hydrolase 14|uniref:Ubiquitin carboxyl-terminal hydrolase n=1 Tax=Nannochloropsis salina CCMP1776 TaxID=1027361 RepID=A0A4D9D8Z3_9STRA|nr:hypothetical protein NSK_002120 [Nannochloropsis salina CCMP1776]|eukprot:TFJ86463.1 hypothetical protein NSK_002120 [Nannochloropsis salina CCMP1776]
MAPTKVQIKWNKQTFSEVPLDTTGTALTFKQHVYELTGVPVPRQKLMCKGAWKLALKDDDDLSKLSIKDGAAVTLIGTADVVKEPVEKVVFVEDMAQADQAKTGAILPAGLRNLGNTCYLNSTLQCLRYVPELRQALNRYTGTGANEQPFLTNALKDTFNLLDGNTEPVPPMQFVMLLRQQFPQFAQQSRGHFMQQDADEFMNELLTSLAANLRDAYGLPSLEDAGNFVDALFGMEVEDTLSCAESEAEKPVVKRDHVRKLVCNIQGGAGSDVKINYLHEGVKLALEGTIEKQSEVLGRDAVWNKTTRIARLPRYLCVQFMRFFWKATPDSQDHAGVKCKSLRTVTFPETLDMFDFCNKTLQDRLMITRGRDVDNILGKDSKKKGDGLGGDGADPEAKGEESSGNGSSEEEAALQAALAMSMADSVDEAVPPAPCGPGLPIDFKGLYELFGVVTHKGRTADGGHYMGWVRQKGDDWLVFDDEDVSECKTAEVLQLSGGGDWHMAYLCFYRFKGTGGVADEKGPSREGKEGAEG